jgi:hypothetical protein
MNKFALLLVLLGSISPVLHVEGFLRTLPGVVVVGSHHSAARFDFLLAFHRCFVKML